MVILRRFVPFLQYLSIKPRLYTRKTVTTIDANMKQVHQELLHYINPYANIKVDSDIDLKVYSADPHMYPDGDTLVVELHGDSVKNCTASMEVKVSEDERNAEVLIRKLSDSTNFHCELAVPLKATLDINTHREATVENTYGDNLKILAKKCIKTKNIRSENIELFAYGGDINCQGMLLGKHIRIEAKNAGNIILDKLHGDYITCKTSQGNITTNCSYVESSNFESETGCMDLKNVHKKAAVTIHQKGDLKMIGVHGNLNVKTNGGSISLQLSELQGQSAIEAQSLTECTINISDDIEKHTSIDVCLKGDKSSIITLESTLSHLSLALTEDKQQLKWLLDENKANNLKVICNSSLTLGKSSWVEMMHSQMVENAAKTS